MERFAVWGGTTATAGNIVLYGTSMASSRHVTRTTATCSGSSSFPRARSAFRSPTPKGHAVRRHQYGVGGWPGVGLVFDLQDPTAGLGAVGAFKKLANYTRWAAA